VTESYLDVKEPFLLSSYINMPRQLARNLIELLSIGIKLMEPVILRRMVVTCPVPARHSGLARALGSMQLTLPGLNNEY